MESLTNRANIKSFFKAINEMAVSLLTAQANISLVTATVFYILQIHPSHDWTDSETAVQYILRRRIYLHALRKLLRSLLSACMLSNWLQKHRSFVGVRDLFSMIEQYNNKGKQDNKASFLFLFSPPPA